MLEQNITLHLITIYRCNDLPSGIIAADKYQVGPVLRFNEPAKSKVIEDNSLRLLCDLWSRS